MRILVANPFGIGDVLFTLPLLRAIREQDPNGFVGFLGNRRTVELIGSWPEVDWHEPFEFRAIAKRSRWEGWRALRRIAQQIRQQRFEVLIDLSMGWSVGCAGGWAGIPRRLGLDYRRRGLFLTEKIPFSGFKSQSIPDHYLDLLPRIGFQKPNHPVLRMSLSPAEKKRVDVLLQEQGIPEGRPLLGLIPGGGASWGPLAHFKQWPPEKFAQAADRLIDRYDYEALLLGDADDQAVCRNVAQAMRHPPRQIVPAPSLQCLAHLLQRCTLVIGNDSGPLHLADAVGTKTVAIFGPVDPSIYGPPAHTQESFRRVVTHGLACRPCYQDFRFPPCPWDNACLKDLKTEQVLEMADAQIAS